MLAVSQNQRFGAEADILAKDEADIFTRLRASTICDWQKVAVKTVLN